MMLVDGLVYPPDTSSHVARNASYKDTAGSFILEGRVGCREQISKNSLLSGYFHFLFARFCFGVMGNGFLRVFSDRKW